METLYDVSTFTGYVYPNETIVPWTVLIVVYPYLTGLVAGAFTVSSLYQVFGFRQVQHHRIVECRAASLQQAHTSRNVGGGRGH